MTKKKITKWGPDDFELEMTTVWSFPDRGNWATHDAKWRGNWSPYIPRNIILRYSQEGDLTNLPEEVQLLLRQNYLIAT